MVPNWITIENYHINLNNIIAFKWEEGFLYISDTFNQPIYFADYDKKLYRKICNACCMNMVEE